MKRIRKYLAHKVKITYKSGREEIGILSNSSYRGMYCLDYKYIKLSNIKKIELVEV